MPTETIQQESAAFLDRMYAFGEPALRVAVDELFDFIDTKLLAGDFDLCDEVLRQVDLSRLQVGLHRSFVAIHFAAKNHLSEYSAFFDRVFTEMSKRRGEQMARKLLDTLR